MPEIIPQFGENPGEYRERICSYAIVINERQQILLLKVRGTYHLPGGGVELGESLEEAVKREAMEEAGCEIEDVRLVGKANQFFLKPGATNLNKICTFYRACVTNMDPAKATEADHVPCWLDLDEFFQAETRECQVWAVRKALGLESYGV